VTNSPGPVADIILAAPGRHGSHAVTAARLARAAIGWDGGQISDGPELMRDAARHSTGISPDARHPQPLLALAAALVDLRQLDEAGDVLRAADRPALRNIPAQAALSILRARIHLAADRLADAAADAQAALEGTGPVAETVVYLRGPGTVVRCRNCFAMLMVISQIRGMNCVYLGGLAALDLRQGD
jgi:hypothetical protein